MSNPDLWRQRLWVWLPALLFFLANLAAFGVYKLGYAGNLQSLEGELDSQKRELAQLKTRQADLDSLLRRAAANRRGVAGIEVAPGGDQPEDGEDDEQHPLAAHELPPLDTAGWVDRAEGWLPSLAKRVESRRLMCSSAPFGSCDIVASSSVRKESESSIRSMNLRSSR